jgi:methionyl-tRNA formyltransferase
MTVERWRVALITNVAPIATGLAARVRELGHDPVAVITPRRPIPIGPDLAITDATAPAGMDVLMPRDKRSLEPMLRSARPDLTLCWGFPWRIPQSALDVAPLGSVNLHPAMLPRLRGPIPLAWTIRSGDDHYAVTWHRMEEAFDTGPILAQATVPMEPDDRDIWIVGPRMAAVALDLLPRVFERVAARDPGDPQVAIGDEPYAGYFGDDYAEIDWSRPAVEIDRQVRAWALAMGNHGVPGPYATLEGRRTLVRRTSLVDPGDGSTKVDAADGPIWITASEPA